MGVICGGIAELIAIQFCDAGIPGHRYYRPGAIVVWSSLATGYAIETLLTKFISEYGILCFMRHIF